MAVSDIRYFVYRVVDIFPGPLKTPARWVADRIFGIWNEIFEHLSIFRPAWNFFHTKMMDLVWTTVNFAEETARTIRWLVTGAIPRWAKWALNTALDVLRRELDAVRRILDGAITLARKQLQAAINAVDSFVKSVRTWATDRFNDVWNTLRVVRDRVVSFLTNPEALVDWIFMALWRRFWRYVDDHAEAIAAHVWARREPYMAKFLARLENFLVRLL